MLMPGRSYNSAGYRWGFNGKPTDNELIDWQDYGERMYMKRLGRFPSPDPLIVKGRQYPELSPYQFSSNTPIQAIDLDGLEASYTITEKSVGKEFEKPVFKSLPSEFIQSKVPTNANFGTPVRQIKDNRTVSQQATVLLDRLAEIDRNLPGGYDPDNSGAEYGGLKGMYRGADVWDNLGDKLSYIPATTLFGEGFQLMADGLRTIADANNEEISKEEANANIAVRAVSTIAGKFIDKKIDNTTSSEVKKYVGKQASRKTLDALKDACTTKPQTDK